MIWILQLPISSRNKPYILFPRHFFKCPQKDFDGLIICVKSPFKGWNIFLTNSMREKWKQNQQKERKVKKGIEGLKIFRKMH